jgi:hypothetical protein
MLEICMGNHVVRDGHCNTVNLLCPKKEFKQGATNNVRFTFGVGDT